MPRALSTALSCPPNRGEWRSDRKASKVTDAVVPTVRGPVAADELGPTLMHEHLLVDLTPGISPSRREAAERAGRWSSPITLQNLDDVRRNYEDYRDNLQLLDSEEAVSEIAFFKEAGG